MKMSYVSPPPPTQSPQLQMWRDQCSIPLNLGGGGTINNLSEKDK